MPNAGKPRRVLIMGAAGRDFHNFNVAFRDDPAYEVVAFTAAQIPGISGRRYPAALAGARYPDGIAILDEAQLGGICRERNIDEVVFAYSDVEHTFVMHNASIALAGGADFTLLGPDRTMLKSRLPVIAICAVRTGVGKSQTARWLSSLLQQKALKVAVMRHPMPYGDLERQAVQRFASLADLDAAACTIEEREEYEPHIRADNVVFAGVDYARILKLAETEADIIVWDGGNNDFPFVRPDLLIVLVDPLRPGHETTHHPGEVVLRMADIVVVAKTNSASEADIQKVTETARRLTPDATVVRAASIVTLDNASQVAGKRVLVVEDGQAPGWAARELEALGPVSRSELLLAASVLRAVFLWIFGGRHLSPTTTALAVVSLMLLCGVLSFDDVVSNHEAWKALIMLATLVRLWPMGSVAPASSGGSRKARQGRCKICRRP